MSKAIYLLNLYRRLVEQPSHCGHGTIGMTPAARLSPHAREKGKRKF